MTNNTSDQKSAGLNGFFLGALIGGSIVFLLGTKKGRQLLHTLTEEGLEGIANIEDLIQSNPEEELGLTEEQPSSPLPVSPELSEKKEEKHPVEKKQLSVISVSKRLFHGIPKKR